MKTGEIIRYLRIKSNLTSKELGKALDISESAISLYENNKRKPSIELIIKISNYFNVSTDFLLGVKDCLHEDILKESGTDFSILLEKAIALLNTKSYIFFDGKDVDDKTIILFKNNLNFVLENMRMMVSN